MTDSQVVRPWWSRRAFLKNSAAVATGAYGFRWGLGRAADIPYQFDGSRFQLAAPEPNPKRGGVLRMGMPMRAPHFDIHQSGTIFTLGAQACMFDNLIRHDPQDGAKTIIPDLAHSWEIAEDGKSYTFFLRQGCAISRWRGTDGRRCQGDLRPDRQAAVGHQHPAQRLVQGGQRDQCARQIHG
jgi:hypothetical protein